MAQSGSSHPRARGDTEALGRASGSANNNDDGHEDDTIIVIMIMRFEIKCPFDEPTTLSHCSSKCCLSYKIHNKLVFKISG